MFLVDFTVVREALILTFLPLPQLLKTSVRIKKNRAIIIGQKELKAADCIASDLRTTFSIILGAIAAKGVSKIERVYHGLRGYYNLEKKLKKIGINISSKK